MTRQSTILPLIAIAAVFLSTTAGLQAKIDRKSPHFLTEKNGDWTLYKLRWDAPATEGDSTGCPIGNGHLGARVCGGVPTEILELNDAHFWSGGPNPKTQDPKRLLAAIDVRKKLAAGDIPGADEAAKGMWGPPDVASYLPVGNLMLDFESGENYSGYSRILDLSNAVCTVSYTAAGVDYTREVFASFPDDIIVMHLTASSRGKINFSARLQYPPEMEGHGASLSTEGSELVMKGRAPTLAGWDKDQGMRCEARVKILCEGGHIVPDGNKLRITDADSALLIYSSSTSYNGFGKEPGSEGADPSATVQATLAATKPKYYGQLLDAHTRDFHNLFRRVWGEINGDEPYRHLLGLQYARYHIICSSRSSDHPTGPQGIWNHAWKPANNCCYFINGSLQKYYSLIDSTNLGECAEPLWSWTSALALNGFETSRVDWGSHGWLAPHYSDIWATTNLKGGRNESAIWPLGGVWLCTKLWQHYTYNQDIDFLRGRAYPLMKASAEFAFDILMNNGKDQYVPAPSVSPESRFELADGKDYAVCLCSTANLGLIRQLFTDCLQAAQILNQDGDFQQQLQTALSKIPPYQIDARGGLMEWSEDFKPHLVNQQHPVPQLLTVWPLSQITEQENPKLFAAARVSLADSTSHGNEPDKAVLWARLKDGDKALSALESLPTDKALAGPFPPDYSCIPEMLLQSHSGEIELLPALPAAWKRGKVAGLLARGGYELSIEWDKGELTTCTIQSNLGTTPVVRYKGALIDLEKDSRVFLHLP